MALLRIERQFPQCQRQAYHIIRGTREKAQATHSLYIVLLHLELVQCITEAALPGGALRAAIYLSDEIEPVSTGAVRERC